MIQEDCNEKNSILDRLDKLQEEIQKIQESLRLKSSLPLDKDHLTNECPTPQSNSEKSETKRSRL